MPDPSPSTLTVLNSNFLQLCVYSVYACVCVQVIAILAAVSLAYYAYYYFDNFHYHVTRGYAHLGYPEAQHIVGQRLLFGMFFCWTSYIMTILWGAFSPVSHVQHTLSAISYHITLYHTLSVFYWLTLAFLLGFCRTRLTLCISWGRCCAVNKCLTSFMMHSIYTVSQKTSKITFVITMSNFDQIWQFLAYWWQIVQNYMRCTHFPPQLTHINALPC